MATEKKQNGNEQKKQSLNNPELSAKGEKDKEKCKGKNTLANEEMPNKFFSWHSRTHTEKTNLILIILSIASLLWIFYMTTEQNELTRKALKRSDTTNAITRESLEFAKRNARIELRAYLQADSVYFYTFRSNEEMVMILRVTNVGQTPAYRVTGLEYPKIGGTGIYEADFMTLKDTLTSMYIGGNNGSIEFRMKTNFFPSKNDSIDITKGKIFLGYYGKFFYRDIFNNLDSFRVCRVYDPKTGDFVLCENYQEYQGPNPN